MGHPEYCEWTEQHSLAVALCLDFGGNKNTYFLSKIVNNGARILHLDLHVPIVCVSYRIESKSKSSESGSVRILGE